MSRSPSSLVQALRWRVTVEDVAFDRLYPDHIRRLSRVHWTPVAVALRAAALLVPESGLRVLDAGAGPGKLCCVGALAYAATWCGVEHDPALVGAAAAIARRLEVDHCTRFCTGDLAEIDWTGFDGFYFYNPFESLLFGGGAGRPAYTAQVERTAARLAALPSGTRVVTFHGFGGAMPPGFALAIREAVDGGELALWIKRPEGARPSARRSGHGGGDRAASWTGGGSGS
jgi:SAM-dependent methyltransferase